VETAIYNNLPWEILKKNNDWKAALRACYKANSYGRCIILAACRPFIWQARSLHQKEKITETIQKLTMLINLIGIGGALLYALKYCKKERPASD
jgi:uncharacterized membrane protein YqgA involved in biofilm formation